MFSFSSSAQDNSYKVKNAANAALLLRECVSEFDKAAKKGVIHANKASNKKSQLSKLMNTLAK
ncbi:MAG: 30S ribosomal protein S20 [Lentisphaeria bacterium]|nr:30S ribosomal protein S20 [Lentisphaeria bacterium]